MPSIKTACQELTLILKFLDQKMQVFQKEIFRMQKKKIQIWQLKAIVRNHSKVPQVEMCLQASSH